MKIVIVGAGPIGCYVACLLREYGFSPLLLEEHPEIGLPKHCAGMVGSSFFNRAKVSFPGEIIKKEVNGALISYKDQSFTLRREKAALVIDREKLDKKLSESLPIKKGTRVSNIKRKKGEYILYTNRGTFHADLIIGADGATSRVRKLSGVKLDPLYYKGAQLRVKHKAVPQDMAQVYFTKPFLHFCWIIPEDDNIARIGAISPTNPLTDIQNLMEKLRIKAEAVEKMGGRLALGYGQTLKEEIALVGDAACQVKPLSGGGLYYGMRCAEDLADCIRKNELYRYDKTWKKRVGKEIRSALRVRKILERTNLKILESLFSLAQKNSQLIEQMADFEYHSTGLFKVARKLGVSLFLDTREKFL